MSLQPEGTMAFMPFYFERFAWSTRGWPPDACWAYLMLLCEQYTTGSLPADPAVLDRLSPGTMRYWELIEPKLPLHPDGRRRNGRCMEHRERTIELAEKRRGAARAAAAARYACESDASRMRNACESDASRMPSGSGSGSGSGIGTESDSETHTLGVAEPVSNNRKRKLPMPDGALERLWALFPRKVGKAKALALLERAIRSYADEWELDALDDAVEVMRERIVAMAAQYRATEQQFIPHPATWLGQGRYLDPQPEER